jgi:hypothetical protein
MSMTSPRAVIGSGGMKDHGSKKESQKKGCKARVKEIGEKTRPHRCKENREEKAGEKGREENGKKSC